MLRNKDITLPLYAASLIVFPAATAADSNIKITEIDGFRFYMVSMQQYFHWSIK